MRKVITLDAKKRKIICKTYGVTNANLSQSLNFRRNGKRNIAMRAMAMEMGGVLLEESKREESEKIVVTRLN
jgi:hypothetical protein